MTIHDINMIGTFAVEFLHKNKLHQHVREWIEQGASSVYLVFIEKLEEDEVVEQHFVEAHITQKMQGRKMSLKQKYNHPQKCRWKYINPQSCRQWQKHNEGRWRSKGVSQKLY
jgi:hypothetical protein